MTRLSFHFFQLVDPARRSLTLCLLMLRLPWRVLACTAVVFIMPSSVLYMSSAFGKSIGVAVMDV